VVDPRTGERVKIFPQAQSPDSFLDQVWQFLDGHSLEPALGPPVDVADEASSAERKLVNQAIRDSMSSDVELVAGEAQLSYIADSDDSEFEDDNDNSSDGDNSGANAGEANADDVAGVDMAPGSGGGSVGGAVPQASASTTSIQNNGAAAATGDIAGASDNVTDAPPQMDPLAPEPAANSKEPLVTIRFVFPDSAKSQRRFLGRWSRFLPWRFPSVSFTLRSGRLMEGWDSYRMCHRFSQG
jgi:hypothetical protein